MIKICQDIAYLSKLTPELINQFVELAKFSLAPISALGGSLLTLWYTNKRERYKFFQDVKYKEFKEFESLCLEIFTLLIYQERKYKNNEFKEPIPDIASRLNLFASKAIVDAVDKAQNKLMIWGELYEKRSPKNIGGMLVVSTQDRIQDSDKSDLLSAWEEYNDSMVKLKEVIQTELRKKRRDLF